ncbi:LysR family transcriptional regulator [Mesorhizobium sp. M7A.F.Ca.ET.027.02.1.1]|uniref:LysR family transcriptional regulator n=1 Tax=Mesorhizobium sp. M7A.F.Ca.ET.027.02.1.1 TaxID=2496655 RepID=UPI001FE2089E|nr:LysR family transcriptional regulator [Mesorhizobium sp. M7A.F.Ca.ET.027.02.1.1]
MIHFHYDIPSLTALEVFEASARHLSFKLAASELEMTSGEIRRQIKAIEGELGVRLIVGPGSDVVLTSAGEDLYRLLASSSARASEVVSIITRRDYSRTATPARRMDRT